MMAEIANFEFLISLTLALCKCKFNIYCEHSFIKRDRRSMFRLHDNSFFVLANLPKPRAGERGGRIVSFGCQEATQNGIAMKIGWHVR